jgi:hypothetical protein
MIDARYASIRENKVMRVYAEIAKQLEVQQ